MGEEDRVVAGEITAPGKFNFIRSIINMAVLALLFVGYSLTFLVPKFYGMTDAYVGVFVFGMLVILFFNNVNLISMLRQKDVEIIVLAILIILIGINIILVNSGKGAFFVLADFVLIFYLCDKILLSKKQALLVFGAYFIMLFIWLLFVYPKMFAEYGFYGYNTNTAATFTIYTLLIAYLFLQYFRDRYEFVGLFLVILLMKGVQLALYHRARGAFIMLLLFLLLRYVIPKSWWLKKSVFRVIYLLATLGSLLFVCGYTVLGMTGMNFSLPIFYKSLFSGREAIWKEFFELFLQHPLTGIGTNVQITSFFEFNVHNAMYNILVVYGIPAFVGTMFFVYRRLEKLRTLALRSGVTYSAMCALIAVFFESYFDVDLLWVDYALNLLVLLLIIGMRTDESEING